jgi:hypothetical protein
MKLLDALSKLGDFGRRPGSIFFAAFGLALYLAYDLVQFRPSEFLSVRQDAGAIFLQVGRIFATHDFPTDVIFPYPPAAVIIIRTLGIAGAPAFMAIWNFLILVSLVAIVRASLAREASAAGWAWISIGFAAVLLADSPVSWDLRNVNSNLIYLGLAMSGYGLLDSFPMLAGAMIGLSVSLKLYSALLLLWLVVNRRTRAVASAALTIVILWALLPICVFGLQGTEHVYDGWLGQLRAIANPQLHEQLLKLDGGPPLVTVQQAVAYLVGEHFSSARTLIFLSLLWIVWSTALLLYAVQWYRSTFPTQAPSRAALADWIVLLIAPLPLSIWLEPYHIVPLLVGALLALVVVSDRSELPGTRFAALGIVAVLLLFLLFRVPFAIRGLGILTQLLVLVFALAYMRPRLALSGTQPFAQHGADAVCA